MDKGHELAQMISTLKCRCDYTDEEIRKKTPLSPAEYRGLLCIEEGETITAADFSKKMGLSPSRGSRVIEKMLEHSYLVTERSTEDRRRVLISLGEKGIDLKKEIAEAANECNRKISERLTDEEIDRIKNAIEYLINVL